jgi:hypothetical protein
MSNFLIPADHWSEKEKLQWMRDIARRFRGGTFAPAAGVIASGSTLDIVMASPTFSQFAGLTTDWEISVSPPPGALPTRCGVAFCQVSAADTVTLRLFNLGPFGATPTDGPWKFLAYLP